MKLLTVCSGNTCRSALASAWLTDSLALVEGEHEATSAGTTALPGSPASDNACAVLAERGVDLAAHRSVLLTAAMLRRADVVLCMEAEHLAICQEFLAADAPPRRPELRLLDEAGFADPAGGDLERYRSTRDLILQRCDRFLAERGLVPYQAFWCEENVWHLLGRLPASESPTYAVLISNPSRSVAFWGQRAAAVEGTPVVWDYHVVAIVHGEDAAWVYDLDCVATRHLTLAAWLAASFPYGAALPQMLQPSFRVVPAARYRELLVSDRRHMLGEDGELLREPPPWRPIGTGAHNLGHFIDTEAEYAGELCDVAGLLDRFGGGTL